VQAGVVPFSSRLSSVEIPAARTTGARKKSGCTARRMCIIGGPSEAALACPCFSSLHRRPRRCRGSNSTLCNGLRQFLRYSLGIPRKGLADIVSVDVPDSSATGRGVESQMPKSKMDNALGGALGGSFAPAEPSSASRSATSSRPSATPRETLSPTPRSVARDCLPSESTPGPTSSRFRATLSSA